MRRLSSIILNNYAPLILRSTIPHIKMLLLLHWNKCLGSQMKSDIVLHIEYSVVQFSQSLTNTTDKRKTMYFPKFDWPRVLNPYIKFPMSKEELSVVKKKEKES